MKHSLRILFLFVLSLTCMAALASAEDFVLITHPSGPDTLSKDDVTSILLGNKTKWDSGGNIKLAILTEGPAHEAVVQTFTSRSADQFSKYWKKQVFTGKGSSPDAFNNDADMVAFVAKTPGSFGYIASGTATNGVKVIKIQ